ncbi:hypothetical protein [Streptomyces acidiscabies]|uniref:hypothetical protein n=1 Tax=Streptomyces acidiscabies TaxID=42234 RepID=UPI0038F7DFB2
MTTCSAYLSVPEHLRETALAFPNGRPGEEPLPDCVTCELDARPHGEHAAELRDLSGEDDGSVWVVWPDAGQAIVRHLVHCPSRSPQGRDACWLAEGHRGGHTWERYE